MTARRAQPGLLASAAIVRALWVLARARPRIRASRASVPFTRPSFALPLPAPAPGRRPPRAGPVAGCQPDAGGEKLFRVAELLARPPRRGLACRPVGCLMDGKFGQGGLGDLVRLHARRAVRRSGDAGGEPPQQPPG